MQIYLPEAKTRIRRKKKQEYRKLKEKDESIRCNRATSNESVIYDDRGSTRYY